MKFGLGVSSSSQNVQYTQHRDARRGDLENDQRPAIERDAGGGGSPEEVIEDED